MTSRREPWWALAATVLGALTSSTLVFAGLGWWGFALGTGAMFALLAGVAFWNREVPLWALLGWTFTFALLTWPVIWLIAALATGHPTGPD